MKKLLLLAMVLAIAVPAMATVNFTATDIGSGQLKIAYTTTAGEQPRGIALKVTITGGATVNPSGGVVATDAAYNCNIDYAYSNPGYQIGQGHPLADPAQAGVLPAAAGTFSICMGVLDQTGNQLPGPGSADPLITLQLDNFSGTATVNIEADTLRGPASGVVGSELPSNLPLMGITVQPPESVSTPNTPTRVATQGTPPTTLVTGQVLKFNTGGSTCTGGHPVEYRFDWGDTTMSAWSATLPQAKSYAAAGTYSVKAQARCSVNTAVESAWSAGLNVTVISDATCVAMFSGAKLTDYNNYKANGQNPTCWCWRFQCRGDANSDTSGFPDNYRIYTTDLNRVIANWKRKINTVPVADPCADVDQVSSGFPDYYRVYTNDLNMITITNWKKKDTGLVNCPSYVAGY